MAERRLVVGVAIERGGCWLVARRTRPASLAGLWEFPGGKVEPGESAAEAAVREIREEMALGLRLTGELPGRWPIDDALEMVVVTAVAAGEPDPCDGHDAVRWVPTEELAEVDWVPADVAPALALAAGAARRAGSLGTSSQ